MSKILVADDSRIMRSKIYKVLTGEGHLVVQAVDGEEALRTAQEQTGISLFLVDINMPNLDGMSLIKKLRALPAYKDTPIFVLTTESSEHLQQEGKESGATAWVVKPFDDEALLSAIHEVIQ